VARMGFTSSSVVRFVRGGAGSGLIGAGMASAKGRLTQPHVGLIPVEAEALGSFLSAPELGQRPRTTHAVGV
jgi:hypothetical protein